MNRNEKEFYDNIKRIAIALEKIADKPDVSPSLSSRGPILTKAGNRVKHI